MSVDYGGMRPTFVYSKEDDPKIQKYKYALESLKELSKFMALEQAAEKKTKETINAIEVQQLNNLNIDVNTSKYFLDENYREQKRDEKKARVNVATKARNFVPEEQSNIPGSQVLSSTILAYRLTLLFTESLKNETSIKTFVVISKYGSKGNAILKKRPVLQT